MKIDSHQVPRLHFQYLVGKGHLQVNAVRKMSHRAQPTYKSLTHRISYRIFDPVRFFDALQESHVVLTTEATYCGNDLCEDSSAFMPLTAEDEIMREKQRAYVPGQKKFNNSQSCKYYSDFYSCCIFHLYTSHRAWRSIL